MLRHRGGCFGNLRGATGATFPEACRAHEHKALKTRYTSPDGLYTYNFVGFDDTSLARAAA